MSEKVQATIPKGIVGGIAFTQVPPGNLREWHERPWTCVCECLWKAEKKKKSKFDSYCIGSTVY